MIIRIASRFSCLVAVLLIAASSTPAPAGGLVDPFTRLLPSPHGIQYQGQFGFAAVTAGDVNGDGFSDVLIGAPFEDNTKLDEGRLHLYLGSATGLALTADRIHVTAQDSCYGAFSVAPAGTSTATASPTM